MKNIYKIEFVVFVEPKDPYFSLPRDLDEVWAETKMVHKVRYISANNEQEAVKHLRHHQAYHFSVHKITQVERRA